MKGNLTLTHAGGELRVDDLPKLMPNGIMKADLCNSGVGANIGWVFQPVKLDGATAARVVVDLLGLS